MIEKSFIHRTSFKVRACEINSDFKIQFPALIQLFQEASLENIIHLKLSAWDDHTGNNAWVLLRKEIKVFNYPSLGQEVLVETFPSGFEKIFAFRDYRMYDTEMNLMAQAASTWTYMDLDTRKVSKIPDNFLEFDASNEKLPLPRPKSKIPVLEDVTEEKTLEIRKYHLDWNGHVNNNHYFKFILEAVSPPAPNCQPTALTIHIKNECLLGEKINIQVDSSSSPILISIVKEDNSIAAYATLIW